MEGKMNKYTLHKAGINVNDGMQRLKLDKTTYESFLIQFLEDQNYKLLCQAIDEKDISLAFLYAHSLKGIAANLSLTKLYLLLSPLTESLRNDSFKLVEELMPQVEDAYQQVIDVLQLEAKNK